jgi:phosphopantothenoylcysteine decarboxylase/phosphopantothenate--cysteine ligase
MFKTKIVVLGVCGGIAAYKIASLASMLKKSCLGVNVIMTKNAQNFISPLTFETLTGNKCITDTFERVATFDIEHISLAKKADYILIAPATANVIGKLANGIADDILTTTVLAAKCPVAIAPSMNTAMLENTVVQENISKLQKYGYKIISPDCGLLACGDTGSGKLPEPSVLFEHIAMEIAAQKDLAGKNVLITAGATAESIDPVRFITNHSTGKMGFALAKAAARRGARVTLAAGRTNLETPLHVERINAYSAKKMLEVCLENSEKADIIIKAAAVADFTPCEYADQKIKKGEKTEISLGLKATDDILKTLGEHKKSGQIICGFAMETQNLLENARKKLKAKNADLICANSLCENGAGFASDTNILTLISKSRERRLEKMSKDDAANAILDEILTLMC